MYSGSDSLVTHFVEKASITGLNIPEIFNNIVDFGFRASILTVLILLGIFLSTRYSENNRYSKLVPFLCATIVSLLSFFYLYNFSAGGRLVSDSSVVHEKFLKNEMIYPNAVGYSYLIIIVANLLNIPIYSVVVFFGTIICPFVLYLGYFLFCKTFLTYKAANLASIVFSFAHTIFSSFISNIKQTTGIIFLLFCLYSVMSKKEDPNKNQNLVFFSACFFFLTFFHLLTFLIGTMVLISVMEGKRDLISIKKRFFSLHEDLLIILLIISVSLGIFYPEIPHLIYITIQESFSADLVSDNAVRLVLGNFLLAVFGFFNQIPFLIGLALSLSYYIFTLFVRILVLLTVVCQAFIKRKFSMYEKSNAEPQVIIASISLSFIIWILYSFYYREYVSLHYVSIPGYILSHAGQVLFYGVSFYLIFVQFIPTSQKEEDYFFSVERGFFLTTFLLLLSSFLVFILLITIIRPIGNLERRVLDFLLIFQISYFISKLSSSYEFKHSRNFRLLSYSMVFLVCILGLLLGTRDPLFFKLGWSDL